MQKTAERSSSHQVFHKPDSRIQNSARDESITISTAISFMDPIAVASASPQRNSHGGSRVKPCQEDEAANQAHPPVLTLAQQKYINAVESAGIEERIFFGKEHMLCLLKQEVILAALRRDDKDTIVPPLAENPTYFSDELLRTLTPVFISRHRQLIIDLLWRAQQLLTRVQPEDEDFEFQTTLQWTRILFDYFKVQLGIEPVIIESEDSIHNTRAVTDKLCALYGLDPEGVDEEWYPVPQELWPKSRVGRTFVGHMLASRGIERGEKVCGTRLRLRTLDIG